MKFKEAMEQSESRSSQYMNEVMNNVASLEAQLLEANKANEEYQKQVEDGNHRFEKLWQSYKTQEDDIKKLEHNYAALDQKYGEQSIVVADLKRETQEKDVTLGTLEGKMKEAGRQIETLNKQSEKRERDLALAKDDLARTSKDLIDQRKEYDELKSSYEIEVERLAKLWKVHEDDEQRIKTLELRLREKEETIAHQKNKISEVYEAFNT